MRKLIFIGTLLFSVAVQSCSKDNCFDSSACNYDPEGDMSIYQAVAGNGDPSPVCEYGNNSQGRTHWYQDSDGDGLGIYDVSIYQCDQPLGYVANDHDADLVVDPKQRAIVTYVGSTSSFLCGAYGAPTKIHMEQTYGSDVVLLNVQYNDLISPLGSFGSEFGSVFLSSISNTVVPQVYFSAANYAMVNRSLTVSQSENNNAADTAINACLSSTLEVGIAAKAIKVGNCITVFTLSKFYEALGEHYIGIYLLEDGVMAIQQNSLTGPAISSHENVIRSAATYENRLGVQSIGSSFSVNQIVSGKNYLYIPEDTGVNANLQVAVVIFKANQAYGISNAVIVDVN
jgi:hypothetical protein